MKLVSPPFHWARIAARRVFILLFACVTSLALTACPGDDDEDGPLGGGSSIQGTWTLEAAEGLIYLRITSNTIRIYFDEGDCYSLEEADIVDSDGDIYTLSFEGVTEEVEIRRVGDNLEADGELWVPSSVNTSNLEICQGPELGQCSTLPLLGLSTSIQGALTTTDPLDGGLYYYDLYRVQPTSTTNLQIRMMSSVIDSYLILFDAEGMEIAFNDDDETMETLDSRLQVTITAGCYMVMATSYGEFETGSYTLETSTL